MASCSLQWPSGPSTDLSNGILVAFYGKPSQAAICFDFGISTQIAISKLRKWSQDLIGHEQSADWLEGLEPRMQVFADRLAKEFPVATDDINELSDEVSITWE